MPQPQAGREGEVQKEKQDRAGGHASPPPSPAFVLSRALSHTPHPQASIHRRPTPLRGLGCPSAPCVAGSSLQSQIQHRQRAIWSRASLGLGGRPWASTIRGQQRGVGLHPAAWLSFRGWQAGTRTAQIRSGICLVPRVPMLGPTHTRPGQGRPPLPTSVGISCSHCQAGRLSALIYGLQQCPQSSKIQT